MGSVPTNLGYRLDLKLLRLTSNNLGRDLDFLMTLRNYTKMEELGIDANQLKGVLPNSIGNLSTLNLIDANFFFFFLSLSLSLNLLYNSFSGKLPVELGNLKNINSLDVFENNLSYEIPATIENCLNLENLHLQGNSFEGIIPSSMASLKGLEQLDVSRNNLSRFIPKGLE